MKLIKNILLDKRKDFGYFFFKFAFTHSMDYYKKIQNETFKLQKHTYKKMQDYSCYEYILSFVLLVDCQN